MDEIIKCGNISLEDFVIRTSNRANTGDIESELKLLRSTDTSNMLQAVQDNMAVRIIKSKYDMIDMNFLRQNKLVQIDDSNIVLPRFGVIDLKKSERTDMFLFYHNTPILKRIDIQLKSCPENKVLQKHLLYGFTEHTPNFFYRPTSDENYWQTNRPAKKIFKKMSKEMKVDFKHSIQLTLSYMINFNIPNESIKKITESSQYFHTSRYYMVIDNLQHEPMIEKLDEHEYNIDITRNRLKNLVIVTNKSKDFYLIDTFNPEYDEKKIGEKNG